MWADLSLYHVVGMSVDVDVFDHVAKSTVAPPR